VQRSFRLTRSEDFKRVRRDGKSYAHPLVVLIALNSEKSVQPRVSKTVRVGVAAGKSVGTAVHRNRAKRLLREAMRTLLPSVASLGDLATGTDLILIARPALAHASFVEVREALLALLQRAKLIPRHES
jgi:ribonuclease P protein component